MTNRYVTRPAGGLAAKHDIDPATFLPWYTDGAGRFHIDPVQGVRRNLVASDTVAGKRAAQILAFNPVSAPGTLLAAAREVGSNPIKALKDPIGTIDRLTDLPSARLSDNITEEQRERLADADSYTEAFDIAFEGKPWSRMGFEMLYDPVNLALGAGQVAKGLGAGAKLAKAAQTSRAAGAALKAGQAVHTSARAVDWFQGAPLRYGMRGLRAGLRKTGLLERTATAKANRELLQVMRATEEMANHGFEVHPRYAGVNEVEFFVPNGAANQEKITEFFEAHDRLKRYTTRIEDDGTLVINIQMPKGQVQRLGEILNRWIAENPDTAAPSTPATTEQPIPMPAPASKAAAASVEPAGPAPQAPVQHGPAVQVDPPPEPLTPRSPAEQAVFEREQRLNQQVSNSSRLPVDEDADKAVWKAERDTFVTQVPEGPTHYTSDQDRAFRLQQRDRAQLDPRTRTYLENWGRAKDAELLRESTLLSGRHVAMLDAVFPKRTGTSAINPERINVQIPRGSTRAGKYGEKYSPVPITAADARPLEPPSTVTVREGEVDGIKTRAYFRRAVQTPQELQVAQERVLGNVERQEQAHFEKLWRQEDTNALSDLGLEDIDSLERDALGAMRQDRARRIPTVTVRVMRHQDHQGLYNVWASAPDADGVVQRVPLTQGGRPIPRQQAEALAKKSRAKYDSVVMSPVEGTERYHVYMDVEGRNGSSQRVHITDGDEALSFEDADALARWTIEGYDWVFPNGYAVGVGEDLAPGIRAETVLSRPQTGFFQATEGRRFLSATDPRSRHWTETVADGEVHDYRVIGDFDAITDNYKPMVHDNRIHPLATTVQREISDDDMTVFRIVSKDGIASRIVVWSDDLLSKPTDKAWSAFEVIEGDTGYGIRYIQRNVTRRQAERLAERRMKRARGVWTNGSLEDMLAEDEYAAMLRRTPHKPYPLSDTEDWIEEMRRKPQGDRHAKTAEDARIPELHMDPDELRVTRSSSLSRYAKPKPIQVEPPGSISNPELDRFVDERFGPDSPAPRVGQQPFTAAEYDTYVKTVNQMGVVSPELLARRLGIEVDEADRILYWLEQTQDVGPANERGFRLISDRGERVIGPTGPLSTPQEIGKIRAMAERGEGTIGEIASATGMTDDQTRELLRWMSNEGLVRRSPHTANHYIVPEHYDRILDLWGPRLDDYMQRYVDAVDPIPAAPNIPIVESRAPRPEMSPRPAPEDLSDVPVVTSSETTRGSGVPIPPRQQRLTLEFWDDLLDSDAVWAARNRNHLVDEIERDDALRARRKLLEALRHRADSLSDGSHRPNPPHTSDPLLSTNRTPLPPRASQPPPAPSAQPPSGAPPPPPSGAASNVPGGDRVTWQVGDEVDLNQGRASYLSRETAEFLNRVANDKKNYPHLSEVITNLDKHREAHQASMETFQKILGNIERRGGSKLDGLDDLSIRELQEHVMRHGTESEQRVFNNVLKRLGMPKDLKESTFLQQRLEKSAKRDILSRYGIFKEEQVLDNAFFGTGGRGQGIAAETPEPTRWENAKSDYRWMGNAYREQALLSGKWHMLNALDMTVRMMLSGQVDGAFKAYGAFGRATRQGLTVPDELLRMGVETVPSEIGSRFNRTFGPVEFQQGTRNWTEVLRAVKDRDVEALRAFRDMEPTTALGKVPGIGKDLDLIIDANRALAMAIESSFRLSSWESATQKIIRDELHPAFLKEVERVGKLGRLSDDEITILQAKIKQAGPRVSADDVRGIVNQHAPGYDDVAEHLSQSWQSNLGEASRRGGEIATEIHLPLGDERVFEQKLGLKYWFPFHVWAVRNVPFYAQTLAENPWLLRATASYENASETERQRLGLPDRFKHKMPIGGLGLAEFMLGRDNVMWINPSAAISVYDQVQGTYEPTEPTVVEKILSVPGAIGIRPFPWIMLPLNLLGYTTDADTTRMTRHTQSIEGLTGVDLSSLPGGVVRDIREKTSGVLPGSKKLPGRAVHSTNQLDYMVNREIVNRAYEETGDPHDPLHRSTFSDHDDPIHRDAEEIARRERRFTEILNLFNPIPTSTVSPTELEIRQNRVNAYTHLPRGEQDSQIRSGLAYLALLRKEGRDIDMIDVYQRYPALEDYIRWRDSRKPGQPKGVNAYLKR